MKFVPHGPTVHGLLNNPKEQFVIPSYQRRYAWRYNQQAALFKDIDMLMQDDGHLFGMVIIHNDSHHGGINQVNLVDGQQRLTTLSILIYCLYESYLGLEKNYEAGELQKLLYCGNPALSIPKLQLGELDHPDYLLILKGGDKDKIRNPRIKEAYKTLYSLIQEKIVSEDDSWIGGFENKLLHTATIVRLDVQEAQDAYKLFETINNRGLRLSATDVLKNFVLGHAARLESKTLSNVKELWAELITTLDGIPSDDFFRQYVSSIYTRKITKSKLVEEFKKHYFNSVKEVDKLGEYNYIHGVEEAYDPNEEDDDNLHIDEVDLEDKDEENIDSQEVGSRIKIEDYIKQIVEAANCYRRIWFRQFDNEKINNALADLQAIRCFPSYIFLMHYLQYDFTAKEKLKVLEMIGSLMMRRHMVGESTAYNDGIFAKLLRLRFDTSNIEVIKQSLLEDYPSDSEFIIQFPTKELKNRNLERARYILTKLEYYITGGTNEFKISGGEDVHVEHIIPQKISSKKSKKEFGDWEEYLGANSKVKHKKQVHLIGNMTLLAGDLNISASNNPFSKKKTPYKKSNIQLTKDLAKKSDFKFRTLKKRGEELAKIAVNIWKL